MAALADRNVGFKGTVDTAQWAKVAGLGVRYAVLAAGALAVKQGTGDRGVEVASGEAWGDGVLSSFDTVTNLNGVAVAAGAGSRWDTLVIRRTWQPALTPTGTAELMLLQGSATKAISADRTTDAGGTTSDQPLALVRFAEGSTVAQEIIDLRIWTGLGGGLYARATEALWYLDATGTTITINGVTWVRQLDAAGTSGEWVAPVLRPDRMSLFGAGAGLAGSLGTADGFLVQAGTTTQKTNSDGNARITFPKAFPNGLLTVVLTNGHDAATAFWVPSIGPSGYNAGDRSSFVYTLRDHAGAKRTGLQHRINWLAIGW